MPVTKQGFRLDLGYFSYTVSIRMTPESIFHYLDYRAFLKAYYEDRKRHARLSYRSFSRRAGLRSPNYLKLVIDGDRNLTSEMAERFAAACGLSGETADYFVALVDFNQARTTSAKSSAYEAILRFRSFRKAHPLGASEEAYYSRWYLPAIRELATRDDFVAEPAWIAERLLPRISKRDAAEALKLLFELGMLRETESGVVQADAIVSTGAEARGVNIVNFHRAMTARAMESIDLIPGKDRDISSLTLCIDPDMLPTLKTKIARFRREILEYSTTGERPEQVVQINFQLFPLSRAEHEEP